MTIDTNSFIGAELIQRAGLLTLFDGLNTNIAAVESLMDTDDQDFATRLGRDYVATELEEVEPENFNEGYRPTLISAPIDNYPNVSVYVNRVTPAPGSETLDQQDAYHDQLVVELMAKSETESED
jgi:hypothetical protein